MDKKKSGIYYGWWMVVCGFFIMALVYASVVSCQGLFIIPVTEEFGIERASFSVTTACIALGLIGGSLFWGSMIQKKGIKLVMVLCCVLVSISLFCFSMVNSVWQFYLLGAIAGVALPGITNIPVSVMINSWFGTQKKGLAMSLVFAGSGVGGMVLTVLLNRIISTLGWRQAYQVNAVLIAAVVLPLVLFVVVATPAAKGLERLGDSVASGHAPVGGMSATQAKKSSLFWLLFLSVMLMAMVNSALLNHQIPYFIDSGFSAAKSANLGAIAVGSLAIGKILIGSLLDKTGLKLGTFLGNSALVLALVTLMFVSNQSWMVYPYVAFYCLGASVVTIAPPLLIGALFGERDYASLVGLINVSTGVGAIFGPTLCAKLFDMVGSYGVAWAIFATTGVLIVILQLVCLKRRNSITDAATA